MGQIKLRLINLAQNYLYLSSVVVQQRKVLDVSGKPKAPMEDVTSMEAIKIYKRLLPIILIGLFMFTNCEDANTGYPAAGETAENGDCVWVAPYYRSDGTCVRGHWRSAPGKDCSKVGSQYQPCG